MSESERLAGIFAVATVLLGLMLLGIIAANNYQFYTHNYCQQPSLVGGQLSYVVMKCDKVVPYILLPGLIK